MRKKKGLTIKELAEQSGVSKTTILSAEKGKVILRVASAAKIAKVFGVSPGIFIITSQTTPQYGGRQKKGQENMSRLILNVLPKEGCIAENIRNLRLLLGLKQIEFAKLLGVDPSTVRDWELGKRNDSKQFALLSKLCRSNSTFLI